MNIVDYIIIVILLLSALKGFITPIFEVGQALGGAIRRISSGKICQF